MIRFQCDYQEGAHPSILKKMEETNYEQTVGYGNDPYCESARKKIRELCNAPEADVHFLVGGTQTNFTVISAILRPYQGALAAVSGHINVHETGAIEATGHKVLALPSEDGKITAAQIREAMQGNTKAAYFVAQYAGQNGATDEDIRNKEADTELKKARKQAVTGENETDEAIEKLDAILKEVRDNAVKQNAE